MIRTPLLATLLAAALLPAQTPDPLTTTVRVPATANPYLAGMPEGTRADIGDRAPGESPLLVGLTMADAVSVSFAASGAVSHGPQWAPAPPNGEIMTNHRAGAEHGIADVDAPIGSLVGVFLNDARPDKSRAPRGLNFGGKRLEFESLPPELKQVFFIGTGRTKSGVVRQFMVPKGATRLFLGSMDGFEWNNNTGSFVVMVTVERTNVASNMFSVDSSIAFANWVCMSNRVRCTPEEPMVETRGPGQYHVLLPAQSEWGPSVPTPPGVTVHVSGVTGTACLEPAPETCHGPGGTGKLAGEGFLAPDEAAGALVTKTSDGRTYFSVNDRSGAAFQRHEGYFEFDVAVN